MRDLECRVWGEREGTVRERGREGVNERERE
jgi:hypothetical protein